MAFGWGNFRTVVENPEVEVKIDELKNKFERFDDQWEGFKWLVSRRPEEISLGKTINEREYRLTHRKGDKDVGLPDIAVIYTFNSDEVIIIAVEAWDSLE